MERDSTLKTVKQQVREFDEDLVRRLIKTIKVNKREKRRYSLNQVMDYYD